jgi:phosphatidylserine/phosphatidylglycerophosphate/cardiolipin synthase-like enzyme
VREKGINQRWRAVSRSYLDAVTSWERETAIELNYLVPDYSLAERAFIKRADKATSQGEPSHCRP